MALRASRAFLLIALVATSAAAQARVVANGSLVQLYLHGEPRIVGEFLGGSGDTVWVQPECAGCGRRGLARLSVDSVFMRVRERAGAGHALIAGVASALVAAVVWVVASERLSDGCRDGIPCAIAVVVAPIAGVLGGVIGWFTGTADAWVLAELPRA